MKSPGWSRRLVQAIACTALCLIAGLVLRGYFAGSTWMVPTLGAALAGGLLGTVLALWRRDRSVLVLTAVGGSLVVAGIVVVPPAVRAGGGLLPAVRSVPGEVVSGWGHMLTVGVPAVATPAVLVLPAVLSWVAAFSSTVIALRSRSMLLPLLPPLLLFVVNLLLASAQPTTRLGLTAAFLALALATAFARATAADADSGLYAEPSAITSADGEPSGGEIATGQVRRWGAMRRGTTPPGRLALGIPVVATTGVLGLAVAAVLPFHGSPFDPRALREPPVQSVQILSPLISLKSQLVRTPPARLFTADVRSSRPLAGSLRLRVAALDQFDGVVWTASARFVRPGARLPVPQMATGRGTRIDLSVNVEHLPDPLLPVPGQPLTVNAPEAEVDVASGAILVPGRQSLADYHYVISGWFPIADTGIRTALPDTTGAAAVSTRLPAGLPPGVRQLAHGLTATKRSPYERLKALEAYLRKLSYGTKAAPGESYAVVARTLLPATPSEGTSFAEQHAAAFAVMARALGFPARVAVGYIVSRQRAASGHITVTTADAHAWPEVNFVGYGWVPFEPTDVRKTGPSAHQPIDDTYAAGDTLQQASAAPSLAPTPSSFASQARRAWRWVLIAIGAVLLAGTCGIWAAKRQRRGRRRHAATASRRVVGAWSEALDRLVECGVAPGPALTPGEIGARAAAALGPEAGRPLLTIAPLVEEAVFAPWEPGEGVVEHAWAGERELAATLGRRLPRALRWRRLVDPRPLFYRPPALRRPAAGTSRSGDGRRRRRRVR